MSSYTETNSSSLKNDKIEDDGIVPHITASVNSTIDNSNSNSSKEEISNDMNDNVFTEKKISHVPTDIVSINEEDELVDPKTLDWDGPGDLDNPHNWPTWKKWYACMVAAILCLVVTMGSSLYVSGVPEIVLRYKVNQTLALAGLTFYLLGLSTVIGAPLSEVFGRKPVYFFSLPISMLFTMGVGLANGHMRIILPLRFLSGVFASPALSVGSGTILDVFDLDEVPVALTFFCLAPFLGPVISPVMGGFACESQGWRWAEWIQLIAGGLILPFIALMPETHKGIILKKRAAKRNIKLKKPTKEEYKMFLKITFTITILRPLKMLVVEPIVLVFSIYIAFIFAVLFAFFEAYPVIYRGVYQMSYGVSGLAFIGIGVGLWLGAMLYLWIDRRYLFPAAPEGTPPLENSGTLRTAPLRGYRDENGNVLPPVPEKFLICCKIGSIALPVALFWQAWTARPDVHWMAPIAAGVPFGFGLILIFFSVLMYFSLAYPPLYVASVIAANNMLRYITSSVFPLFTIQMYENLKIKWASTLFALICVVMVPVPWIFERWGAKLRNVSQFGWAAMKKEQEEREKELEDNEEKAKLRKTLSNISHSSEPVGLSRLSRKLSRSSMHTAHTSQNSMHKMKSHPAEIEQEEIGAVRSETIFNNVDDINSSVKESSQDLSSRMV
ncbi:hypothetical protein Kpol_413p2 [Vanderwaltozyma polyspora DSM 70294]|uniref:Major facilitator superfamily (MFS) profile domain-containing protein n=1 Tax=Vanderwaltozyma polyspora (strain ATCC 22028 / DSM 70294 / BCRC 21397 / CBS 2163 / NBRC 10782 / NRRL Y-8283 / UCD 57-17) TaxID=436907 RepID=A7TRG7_VANPO|nr:uncharacterized protein Kpol_413p2 [Vanderwaltozyma polyspora DSM 70294]EDO15127.1 hypothetical protein Kpol_413p2 [Vanderwaltozyma polyspora DSM 70294]